MKRSELEHQLHRWSTINEPELGFYQEWHIVTEATDTKVVVEIYENDDRHLLAMGSGCTLQEACDNVAENMPEALEFWSWPTKFPV